MPKNGPEPKCQSPINVCEQDSTYYPSTYTCVKSCIREQCKKAEQCTASKCLSYYTVYPNQEKCGQTTCTKWECKDGMECAQEQELCSGDDEFTSYGAPYNWKTITCGNWQTGGGTYSSSYDPPGCSAKVWPDGQCTSAGWEAPAERTYSASYTPSCRKCRRGSFSVVGVHDAQDAVCQKCPKGWISSSNGAGSCSACPAGQHSSILSANGASSCTACPKGWHSTGATTACRACPGGWVNPHPRRAVCTKCQAGTFQPNSKSFGSCTVCGAGTYQPSEGSTSCVNCPMAKYNAHDQSEGRLHFDSEADCLECSVADGMRINAARTKCEHCPDGAYGRTLDAHGNQLPQPICTLCPTCSPGESLYRSRDRNSCTRNSPGTCSACPLGWYKSKGHNDAKTWTVPMPTKLNDPDGVAPPPDNCLYCGKGAEPNTNSGATGCQYCNYQETAPASDVSTLDENGHNFYRRYKPVGGPEMCKDGELARHSGAARRHPGLHSNTEHRCPVGTFPTRDRTECRQVVTVSIADKAGGFDNFDTVPVSWSFSHVSNAERDATVMLCALKFAMLAPHARCLGTSSISYGSSVDRVEKCARKADGMGARFFNHKPGHGSQAGCEVMQTGNADGHCNSQDRTLAQGTGAAHERGWHAYQIGGRGTDGTSTTGSMGWEPACIWANDYDSLAFTSVASHANAVVNSASLALDSTNADYVWAGGDAHRRHDPDPVWETGGGHASKYCGRNTQTWGESWAAMVSGVSLSACKARCVAAGRAKCVGIVVGKYGNRRNTCTLCVPPNDPVASSRAGATAAKAPFSWIDNQDLTDGSGQGFAWATTHLLQRPGWRYTDRCQRDPTFFKARVGLQINDDGPVVAPVQQAAIATGIPLETIVYSYSDGDDRLRGNTAPTIPKSKVRMLPSVVYPTSPIVACDVDIAHAADPDHASLQPRKFASFAIQVGRTNNAQSVNRNPSYSPTMRTDADTIKFLAAEVHRRHGRIEPARAGWPDQNAPQWSVDRWPGGLALVADAAFPPHILRDHDLLTSFVEECLLDQNAISNAAMVKLFVSVRVETALNWEVFAKSNYDYSLPWDESTLRSSFGRTPAHGGPFGPRQRFRCAVELTDGCERGHTVSGAEHHEVAVTPLELSVGSGYSFDAVGDVDVDIVGAGFLAGRDDYTCSWQQGSYQQTTSGVATHAGKISCRFPKWYGVAGMADLGLSGSFLEYRGCYDTSSMQGLTEPTTHTQAHYKHSGLAACQQAATLASPAASVFALGPNSRPFQNGGVCGYASVSEAALQAHDKEMAQKADAWWRGIANAAGNADVGDGYNPFADSAGPGQGYGVLGEATLFGVRVGDDKCNSPCPVDEASGLSRSRADLATEAEKLARDNDLLQPQRCGGEDTTTGKVYRSVYAASRMANLPAGTYSIKMSPPGAPTWESDSSSVLVGDGPGQIALYWDPPVFMGGAKEISQYEVKFRVDPWQPMAEFDHIVNPSSHASLCAERPSDDGEHGNAISTHGGRASTIRPTWGAANVGGLSYRLCSMDWAVGGTLEHIVAESPGFDQGKDPDQASIYNQIAGLNVGRSESVVVEYLDPRAVYIFRVRLRTQHEWGPWSVPQKTRPGNVGAPASVRDLRLSPGDFSSTPYLLNITWDRPIDDGGSYLHAYEVTVRELACDDVVVPMRYALLVNRCERIYVATLTWKTLTD